MVRLEMFLDWRVAIRVGEVGYADGSVSWQ